MGDTKSDRDKQGRDAEKRQMEREMTRDLESELQSRDDEKTDSDPD